MVVARIVVIASLSMVGDGGRVVRVWRWVGNVGG